MHGFRHGILPFGVLKCKRQRSVTPWLAGIEVREFQDG
jgi:hypothetical protein